MAQDVRSGTVAWLLRGDNICLVGLLVNKPSFKQVQSAIAPTWSATPVAVYQELYIYEPFSPILNNKRNYEIEINVNMQI